MQSQDCNKFFALMCACRHLHFDQQEKEILVISSSFIFDCTETEAIVEEFEEFCG